MHWLKQTKISNYLPFIPTQTPFSVDLFNSVTVRI